MKTIVLSLAVLFIVSTDGVAENRALIRDSTGRTVGQIGSQGKNINVYKSNGALTNRYSRSGNEYRETFRAPTVQRPSSGESRPTYSARQSTPQRSTGSNFGFRTPSRLNR